MFCTYKLCESEGAVIGPTVDGRNPKQAPWMVLKP